MIESTVSTSAVAATLSTLRQRIDVTKAHDFLVTHRDEIMAALRDNVLTRIPAFSASHNPDVLPQLTTHSGAHADEIARLVLSGDALQTEFIAQHATQRARQHFPLDAMLHAYRCGHRVFADWLRRAAEHARLSPQAEQARDASAEFAMEYTDAISTIAATAYAQALQAVADRAGDRRAELMRLLLEGCDEGDARGALLLREAGYLDRRMSFCVVLAQSADPAEMLRPERAQRLADALEDCLAPLQTHRHHGMHGQRAVVIVSHQRRSSGWTAPGAPLADQLRNRLALIGPAAHIGISNDAASTARIPFALREAELALRMAAPDRRVVQLAELPLRQLLALLAGDEARSAIPTWARRLIENDPDELLVTTLRAYADASMNVVKTALRLDVHPNTVYTRLDRIRALIGQEPRRYHVLETLLIASDMVPARSA